MQQIVFAQGKGLVNTENSPCTRLYPVGMTNVTWTTCFWAKRFSVCSQSMVPHMLTMYLNDSISHGFANFEIAAGLKPGEHVGPPFHDGDFYKILEPPLLFVQKKDKRLGQKIDSMSDVIGQTQREDGYIHTPAIIEQLKNHSLKNDLPIGLILKFITWGT